MVLQSIRDRLTGIIAVFVLGLLIIPFAFVGVSSYFTSDAVNAVAVVNDEEITANEFAQGFQTYRRQMQARLGAAFDPEQFDQAIVRRGYLDQLIDEKLLAQVSIDAGLTVSDEMLARTIRELPGFQVDGEFNADVYQANLAAQGLTPQQFEQDILVTMVLSQLPTAIATSAISTKWEMQDYARLQDQERAFRAIVIPVEAPEPDSAAEAETADAAPEEGSDAQSEPASTEVAAGSETEVDEEAILAWYESNQDLYRSEEQVVIEYLELDAAELGGSVEPDEEVLRAEFEEQKVRFITPESRLVSHILLELDSVAPEVDVDTRRREAEDLARRVRDGENFADLAREYSEDFGSADQGGDLGWIEPGFMVQAFEDAAYELTLDHPVSDPVKTGFGWHVIQLRDVRPSEGMTYTEARDILLEEYRAEAEESRFLEQADRLVDIVYEDPTTLSAAAEELGLEVQEAGPFGRLGGAGVAANQNVVAAAFSDLVLGQRTVSDPIDLGDNHMVLVHVKEYLPEAIMPLEEVREQVVGAVRRQQAMDAALARAQELLTALQEGAAIGELAESGGLELVEADAAKRNSAEIDGRLREQVFLMEAPAEDTAVTQVVELDNGYAVVELEAVRDGSLAEDDELRKQAYARRIASASATEEAQGFVRMLRAQSTVEVYEDRL
jgi:peptidyl-prolyl cis-trans isomerase D